MGAVVTTVDNAVYKNGHRTADPANLDETFELMRQRAAMAWIGMYRADPVESRAVSEEFGLHALAVEDALRGYQRAKLERYGDILFMVLRPARYVDADETVEFGEVHVFVGPEFVLTIRQAEAPDLRRVRRRMEGEPQLLGLGPQAVRYGILDEVVDSTPQ